MYRIVLQESTSELRKPKCFRIGNKSALCSIGKHCHSRFKYFNLCMLYNLCCKCFAVAAQKQPQTISEWVCGNHSVNHYYIKLHLLVWHFLAEYWTQVLIQSKHTLYYCSCIPSPWIWKFEFYILFMYHEIVLVFLNIKKCKKP